MAIESTHNWAAFDPLPTINVPLPEISCIEAERELTCKPPALMDMEPMDIFPARVNVPAPFLIISPVPEMLPEKVVEVPLPPTVSVPVPSSTELPATPESEAYGLIDAVQIQRGSAAADVHRGSRRQRASAAKIQ